MQIDFQTPLDLTHRHVKGCTLWLKAAQNNLSDTFVDLTPYRTRIPLVARTVGRLVKSHINFNGSVVDVALGNPSLQDTGVVLSSSIKKWGSHSGYFGTPSAAYLQSYSNPNLNSVAKTIEMWLYPTTFSGNRFIFTNRANNSDEGVDFYYNGANIYFGGPYVGALPTAAHNMILNDWNYINLSQLSNGTTTLTINGNVISTVGLNPADWMAYPPLIGNNYGTNAPVNAYIDDFRLTVGTTQPATVPTAEFVAESTNQYVWETQGGRGISLNTNHYKSNFVTVPNMPTGNASRTVVVWYKQDVPNTNAELVQIGSVNGGGQRWSPFINNDLIHIEGAGASANITQTPDTSWHMLAATLTGTTYNTAQLYLDGTSRTTSYAFGGVGVNTSNQFAIGNIVGFNHDFYGLLDDIRIYNRVLSAAEIMDIYRDSFGLRYSAIRRARNKELNKRYFLSASGTARIFPNKQLILHSSGTGL